MPLKPREINPDQMSGLKAVCTFFQGLSHASLLWGFTRLQMTGGVVEFEPLRGVLFDEQKTPLALNDGRNGDAG